MHGEAFVREPREGRQVSFVLNRNPPDRTHYALVLKVNGLNKIPGQSVMDVRRVTLTLLPGRFQ